MGKRAICVGINDYPFDGSDLNGCVNDAKAWSNLLIEHYDFQPSNVKVLIDAKATKAEIFEALKFLIDDASSGDVLVFTVSSHGTYLPDEQRGYVEAICPYDCANNLILDDELRKFFSGLIKGVHFTMVLDVGFSGTVTRAAVAEIIPGLRTPDERRMRFLSPNLSGRPGLTNPWKVTKEHESKDSKMKGIVLRGCLKYQYTYDALIMGTYHGAMTYYALKAIQMANYKITYAQLESRLSLLLDEAGYPQHPQLLACSVDKKRLVFT